MLVMGFFVFLSACVADVEASRAALVNVAGFKADEIFPMTGRITGKWNPHTLMSSASQVYCLVRSNRMTPSFSTSPVTGLFMNSNSFLLATNSNMMIIVTPWS
ncbi:hypothetical protein CMK14_00480 [Candidatus Poribacteria bacterium]|nr:hypothetical protein [Candidatus Poribacteria bacterium]